MNRSNRPEKKTHTNHWLIALAIFSTTLLGSWGIWSDDDLILNLEKREQHPTKDRDIFSSSLKKHVQNSFSPEFCDNPSGFFKTILIGEHRIASSPLPTLNASLFGNLEQEAIRRCESHHISPHRASFCFIIEPGFTGDNTDSFLAADRVMVEVNLSFRTKNYQPISCKQALSYQPELISMELYYSLYWPFIQNKDQLPLFRITGGISSPLKETRRLLTF